MSAPPGNVIVLIDGALPPPYPDPGDLMAAALAALALLAAFRLAWRRRGDPLKPGFARSIRVAAAGAFVALVPAVGEAVALAFASVVTLELVAMVAMKAAVIALAAALLFALADPLLEPWVPTRRWSWLVAAPLGFALLLTLVRGALAWKLDDMAALAALPLLETALLGAGAGLIWFALLPAERGDLAARFE